MLFNSLSFAFFLPCVFALYWFAMNRSLKKQNLLLLAASYFFYASWDYRFLFLLIFSTLLDYTSGIRISKATSGRMKKGWLLLSIVINLGFLGLFKYYNFFILSFSEALHHLGVNANLWTLKIILPLGISFYTFHGLSYIIDVYRNKIRPEFNIVDYSLFVSFFPLLVAGPIERAAHLLPQIKQQRTFNYSKAVDGMRQILWGLFKKIVIADNCTQFTTEIFNHSSTYGGSTLFVGMFLFSVQIYCDFSGYSDIAIGTAHLFGIDLLRNFAYPYFSRDIAEFWRRWHISLSTWFRDYLYIPLGGSRGNTLNKIKNTIIIFLVSGFWHGANWTFIAWGLLNALYILPSIVLKTNRNNLDIVAQGKLFPSFKELYMVCSTFLLTMLGWVFFRAANLHQGFQYIGGIFSRSIFSIPNVYAISLRSPLFIFIVFALIIEWKGRENQFALQTFAIKSHYMLRWSFYFALVFLVYCFASTGPGKEFIYFQF